MIFYYYWTFVCNNIVYAVTDMADEDKYWECKICGTVYRTYPWEKQPESKCEYLCKIYANGSAYKYHKWFQIDKQTYDRKYLFQSQRVDFEALRPVFKILRGKALKSDRVYEQEVARAREFRRKRAAEQQRQEWLIAAQRAQEKFDRMTPQERAAYLKEEENKRARYRRQEFWRKNKKYVYSAIGLAVVLVLVIFSIKYRFEIENIFNANGISSDVKTVAYDANIIKDFKHAVFECGDYRKISGDTFMVHGISGNGLIVTYANQKSALPYDARKPLSKNGMYLWSAKDLKGFYVKPTMEGYQIYTYKTPEEMANNKMNLYGVYACGSFIDNTRYPFLHKEHVSRTFTDLFDTADLKLMRNSIFASHGFVFKSDEVIRYFRKYPWYHPGNNNLDDYTQIEKDNVKFIKKIEDDRNKKK